MLCDHHPISFHELPAYLFQVIETTSIELSFATEPVIVALSIYKWQLFQDNGSFLQQKILAENQKNSEEPASNQNHLATCKRQRKKK